MVTCYIRKLSQNLIKHRLDIYLIQIIINYYSILKKYLKKYQEEPLLVTGPGFDVHKFTISKKSNNFFSVLCYLNSPKNFNCLSSKFRTEFTSLIAKSISPGLSDMTLVAHNFKYFCIAYLCRLHHEGGL